MLQGSELVSRFTVAKGNVVEVHRGKVVRKQFTLTEDFVAISCVTVGKQSVLHAKDDYLILCPKDLVVETEVAVAMTLGAKPAKTQAAGEVPCPKCSASGKVMQGQQICKTCNGHGKTSQERVDGHLAWCKANNRDFCMA